MEKDKWKVLGIMGGTFNPIHYGHLVAAETARVDFNMEKIIFVPSSIPPHKMREGLIDARLRYEMTELAVASNPHFEVSSIELNRPGPSYTIDTILEFREIYGECCDIYFITGADAILEILSWKDIEHLLKLCTFVAVTRPGYDVHKLKQKIRDIQLKYGAAIHMLSGPGVAISSTEIRERCSKGKSIKYLVPELVEEFIIRTGLYMRSGIKAAISLGCRD
jgi:nicotinate-nucleotide adenylyltransferase